MRGDGWASVVPQSAVDGGAWSSGRARLVLSVSESGIENREGLGAACARSVTSRSERDARIMLAACKTH